MGVHRKGRGGEGEGSVKEAMKKRLGVVLNIWEVLDRLLFDNALCFPYCFDLVLKGKCLNPWQNCRNGGTTITELYGELAVKMTSIPSPSLVSCPCLFLHTPPSAPTHHTHPWAPHMLANTLVASAFW